MPSVVALVTDFGTRDPYVAAMKSVIASRCDATILDLTHEIPPYDVFEAALVLTGIADYLERKQFIVVAVVDPGVGTERRLLAMERKGQIFIAPDNGLLSLLDGEAIRSVENTSLFLPDGSNTFHGRDRFAPVAAALAAGASFDELGPEISLTQIVKLDYQRPRTSGDVTVGTVIAIDRYGNAVTDIPAEGPVAGAELQVGEHRINAFARTYQDVERGAFMIIGSRRTFEISVANSSAADLLQIARFDRVELHRRKS
jgi:S-adenosylmethionine hydrolase